MSLDCIIVVMRRPTPLTSYLFSQDICTNKTLDISLIHINLAEAVILFFI